MANLSLSIGNAASGTQNVTANNDTVTFTSTGWKGGTSWSSSTSNCSVSPSSATDNNGTVTVTVSNFPRSTSNGSWSVTISGNRSGAVDTAKAVGSGTIAASTGSISITGMDSNNAFGIGDTGTVSWTSNDVSAKGYNSTGTASNPRFSPKDGSNTLSGVSGSFTCTAVGTGSGNPAVALSNGYSLRLSGAGSSTIADSNSVVIHNNANAGTATATVTNSDIATGNFTVTGSTTATAPGTVNYRFLNSTGNLMPGSGYSTTNSYVYPATERNNNVEMEVREQIISGSTVYSQSFTQDFVTAPYISPNTGFSVSAPQASVIEWDDTSFTVNISGAQQSDQIRVVLNGTNTALTGFTTVPASGALSLSCTASVANFPRGTAVNVSCQVRRPTSTGGNNSTTGGIGVFSVTRNYRYPRLVSVPDQSATIGAQEGEPGGPGTPNTTITLTGDFTDSQDAVYQLRVGGTPVAQSNPVSGTTIPIVIPQANLPGVNSSTIYQVYAKYDIADGGDGIYNPVYSSSSPIPGGGRECFVTVTRSDYVAPDTTTGPFVISGATATGSTNTYVIGFNDSANKNYTIASTETSQAYIVEEGGSTYASFGTGNSSLSGTILNSDIPTGSTWDGVLKTAVPISSNGSGTYSTCTEAGGSPLIFLFISKENALVTPGILSFGSNMKFGDLTKIVPWVRLSDTGANDDLTGGEREFAWSTITSTPSGWFKPSFGDVDGYNTANFSLDKFTSGATTASYTVYFGVRNKSAATGATTTPNYGSVVVNGSSFVTAPGGINAVGYLNQVNEGGGGGYISQGTNEILLTDSQTTTNETVVFEGLGDPTAVNTVAESDYGNSTLPVLGVAQKTTYRLEVNSGTTQNGSGAGTLLDQQFLAVSSSSITQTILNPSELPTTGNTTGYKFYRQQTKAQGGDDTKQVPNQAASVSEFTARRYKPVDVSATATPAKTTLTATGDTTLNVTIAGGSSPTEYRLRNTTTSQNIADTQVGNGTITIQSSELPSPNSSASYKLQARVPISSGGLSDSYQDTSPLSTFTLNRLQLADGTVSITVPNTTLTAEDTSNQIISLSQGNNNTQYRIRVTASTGGPSVNDVVGESIPTGSTTSFTLIPLTNELPTAGASVDYIVEYREVGTSTYLAASGTNTTFTINRLAVSDTNIVVNSVPANRFTISAQSSFTINISAGNSTTDYRVVLVSQTGTNLTVGSVYGSRTGNGDITLTGTPAQGEFATYKIQGRPTGSSIAWVDATGTNATFTAGRYETASFEGSSGGSITDVPINSSVSTATVSLSGVVGTTKVYVSANTGNATVKVIKNTDTPVIATNASPVNAVNGDIIGLQFTVGGGYSETSTATIKIDQPLNTTLQEGPVFSITTEASPGGSQGGGGGTGDYGLELRDSSSNLILTNSDLVGDFCYSDTVSIANGGTTGISGVNTKGGNVVLILENLNPFTDNQRAEAVLENSGKQVRINLVDATASTALTFNVLVFQL